jgi:hypothetical protein
VECAAADRRVEERLTVRAALKDARDIKALSQTSPRRANILVVIGHDS